MGTHVNIDHQTFPKQGSFLNQRVKVCFNYDTDHIINGVIVRDDSDEPFQMIIKLDDSRYVRSVECQYSPI